MTRNQDSDLRLLQVFLSPAGRGVFEVSAYPTGRLHCTCPGHRVRGGCKHTDFVFDRLVDGHGEYAIAVPPGLAESVLSEALASPEGYREFVLRFGVPEVL